MHRNNMKNVIHLFALAAGFLLLDLRGQACCGSASKNQTTTASPSASKNQTTTANPDVKTEEVPVYKEVVVDNYGADEPAGYNYHGHYGTGDYGYVEPGVLGIEVLAGDQATGGYYKKQSSFGKKKGGRGRGGSGSDSDSDSGDSDDSDSNSGGRRKYGKGKGKGKGNNNGSDDKK